MPVAYWLIVLVAVSAAGFYYEACATVAAFLLLQALNPSSDAGLLSGTSVLIGTCGVQTFHMLVSGDKPYWILEPLSVAAVAYTLFICVGYGAPNYWSFT